MRRSPGVLDGILAGRWCRRCSFRDGWTGSVSGVYESPKFWNKTIEARIGARISAKSVGCLALGRKRYFRMRELLTRMRRCNAYGEGVDEFFIHGHEPSRRLC